LLCSTVSTKKRRGLYTRRNDFGFGVGVGLYIFVHRRNIETRPGRKTENLLLLPIQIRTNPSRKWTIRVKDNNGHSNPTNQQLTRWFMDTLRNDRTDDENRRDNVVAIRDVLAYSSQLELTDAVGAEVQEQTRTLEVANVLLSKQARIEVIHRGQA
jgi:P pilus assembly chaperone PapD